MADELFPLSNNPKKIRDHRFKDSTQDKTVDTFIEESDTTRETFIRIIRSKSISIGFSFIFLLINTPSKYAAEIDLRLPKKFFLANQILIIL